MGDLKQTQHPDDIRKGEPAPKSNRALNDGEFSRRDKTSVQPVSGNAGPWERVRLPGCFRLQAGQYANTSIQSIYRCRVREKLVQAITGGVSNPGPPMACARSKVWQEIGNCRGEHETRGMLGRDGVVPAWSFPNGTPSQRLLSRPPTAPRAPLPAGGGQFFGKGSCSMSLTELKV